MENTTEFRKNDSVLLNVPVNSTFSMSFHESSASTELFVKALQDLRGRT